LLFKKNPEKMSKGRTTGIIIASAISTVPASTDTNVLNEIAT